MIWQVIGGILFGLFAGPIIFFIISIIVYILRQGKVERTVDELYRYHNEQIKRTRKEYEKLHKRYMDQREQLIKIVDKMSPSPISKGDE